uniref:GT23 domain-containing protein n=1 Tax=Ciona intestinalis TaxID=7719 RepID=F6TEP2_CIOIN
MKKKTCTGTRKGKCYMNFWQLVVDVTCCLFVVCSLYFLFQYLRTNINKRCETCTNRPALKLKWDFLKNVKQRQGGPVTKLDVERTKLTMELKKDVELWWKTIKAELLKYKNTANQIKSHEDMKRPMLREQYMALDIKMENLASLDEGWQKEISKKSAKKVEKIIDKFQNPKRCDEFGQLYIKVERCGFGCIMHDLTNKLN